MKHQAFAAALTALLSTFLLAAMLGQLDSILASWYMNPKNTWSFPLTQNMPAIEAWEIIYGLILLCFGFVFAAGYFMGQGVKD
jgi:hypothetical protein